MKTLRVNEAAAFLGIHPKTLARLAAAGKIAGAKIGRAWIFLEVDLVAHIRSNYQRRVSESDHEDQNLCHSIDAKAHPCGGSISPTVDNEYNAALALPT